MTTDIRATITRLKELDLEFLLDQENKPMKRTLAAIAFGLLV